MGNHMMCYWVYYRHSGNIDALTSGGKPFICNE